MSFALTQMSTTSVHAVDRMMNILLTSIVVPVRADARCSFHPYICWFPSCVIQVLILLSCLPLTSLQGNAGCWLCARSWLTSLTSCPLQVILIHLGGTICWRATSVQTSPEEWSHLHVCSWSKHLLQHLINITHQQWLYQNARLHLHMVERKIMTENQKIMLEVSDMMLVDPLELLPCHVSLLQQDFLLLTERCTLTANIRLHRWLPLLLPHQPSDQSPNACAFPLLAPGSALPITTFWLSMLISVAPKCLSSLSQSTLFLGMKNKSADYFCRDH